MTSAVRCVAALAIEFFFFFVLFIVSDSAHAVPLGLAAPKATVALRTAAFQLDASTRHELAAAIVTLTWNVSRLELVPAATGVKEDPKGSLVVGSSTAAKTAGLVRLQCGVDVADSYDATEGVVKSHSHADQSSGGLVLRHMVPVPYIANDEAQNEDFLPASLQNLTDSDAWLAAFGMSGNLQHEESRGHALHWVLPLSHKVVSWQTGDVFEELVEASAFGRWLVPGEKTFGQCLLILLPPEQQPRRRQIWVHGQNHSAEASMGSWEPTSIVDPATGKLLNKKRIDITLESSEEWQELGDSPCNGATHASKADRAVPSQAPSTSANPSIKRNAGSVGYTHDSEAATRLLRVLWSLRVRLLQIDRVVRDSISNGRRKWNVFVEEGRDASHSEQGHGEGGKSTNSKDHLNDDVPEEDIARFLPDLSRPVDQERVPVPRVVNVLESVHLLCEKCVLDCDGHSLTLRFDPTTTPGDMSRQVSPGDMVRVGTAILNDLQVLSVNKTFITFFTACKGTTPPHAMSMYALRPREGGIGGDQSDQGGGLGSTAQCVSAATAAECLASPRCLWDTTTLSCDFLPRDDSEGDQEADTTTSEAPSDEVTASPDAALSNAKALDISKNLSAIPVPAVKYPSARLLTKMPKFVMPKPVPKLPKAFDPLAALMKILMMLKSIIMPILVDLLKPVLKIFISIVSDVVSLILGPFLFPRKGLPFPFPLRFPPFPPFKLPALKVPLPPRFELDLSVPKFPGMNLPSLGVPGFNLPAGNKGKGKGGGNSASNGGNANTDSGGNESVLQNGTAFSVVFNCTMCASKQPESCDVVFTAPLPQAVFAGDSVVFSDSAQPYGVKSRTYPDALLPSEPRPQILTVTPPCPTRAFYHQNATFYGWGGAQTYGPAGAVGLTAFDERSRATGKQVVRIQRRSEDRTGVTGVRAMVSLQDDSIDEKRKLSRQDAGFATSSAAEPAAFVETGASVNTDADIGDGTRVPPPVDWKESSKLPTAIMDQVIQYLAPDLQLGIGFNLGDALINTVTDEVTQQLPGRLAEYLATAIDRRVSGILTQAVLDEVLEPVALQTIASTSFDVLRNVSEGVVRILPRALAHAIVPALVHTISHSPLQDYYCYYCFKHKTYCSYCHYAPEQLYFAQYYTSFYVGYFAEYYADKYSRLWQTSEV